MYTSRGIHFLLSSSNFVWCGTCWNLIAVWKSVDSETPKKFQIGHSALFFLSILRFSHQLKIGYLMIVLNTIINVSNLFLINLNIGMDITISWEYDFDLLPSNIIFLSFSLARFDLKSMFRNFAITSLIHSKFVWSLFTIPLLEV